MVLSIYNLLEASLLMVNAIVVLHEERFLAKIGWGRRSLSMINAPQMYGQANDPSMKAQMLNMIHSIRTVMSVPLIFVNIIVIVIKLIFG